MRVLTVGDGDLLLLGRGALGSGGAESPRGDDAPLPRGARRVYGAVKIAAAVDASRPWRHRHTLRRRHQPALQHCRQHRTFLTLLVFVGQRQRRRRLPTTRMVRRVL